MFKVDHLGIAVKSIAQARKFYEQLGMHVIGEEVVEHEKVRAAMVPVGESRLELLEPTSDDSVIAKFISKRGEGHRTHVPLSSAPSSGGSWPERRSCAATRSAQPMAAALSASTEHPSGGRRGSVMTLALTPLYVSKIGRAHV